MHYIEWNQISIFFDVAAQSTWKIEEVEMIHFFLDIELFKDPFGDVIYQSTLKVKCDTNVVRSTHGWFGTIQRMLVALHLSSQHEPTVFMVNKKFLKFLKQNIEKLINS
jgi:hypothetical protein